MSVWRCANVPNVRACSISLPALQASAGFSIWSHVTRLTYQYLVHKVHFWFSEQLFLNGGFAVIDFEVLSAITGHATITIEEDDPNERKNLAKTVTDLLQKGHTVFLLHGEDTRRIEGYDPDKNEWMLAAEKGVRKPRVSAAGSKAMATAPSAGG